MIIDLWKEQKCKLFNCFMVKSWGGGGGGGGVSSLGGSFPCALHFP